MSDQIISVAEMHERMRLAGYGVTHYFCATCEVYSAEKRCWVCGGRVKPSPPRFSIGTVNTLVQKGRYK